MKKLLFILLVGNFLFAQGELIWKKDAGELPSGGSSWSTPLIMNNKIYWAGQDKGLAALDAETGDIVWIDTLNLYNGTYDNPVGYAGKIFISRNDYMNSSSRSLLALDAETGNLIWQKDNFYAANRSAKPIGEDGKLYAASDDTLFCFDINDGSVVWRKAGRYSNLLIDYNGVRLFAARSDSAKIEVMYRHNGELAWSINLPNPDVSVASMAYINYLWKEYLIIAPGTRQNPVFYCMDIAAQSILWNSDNIGYVGNKASPVIFEDKVFAGVEKTTASAPQEIVAFSLLTGTVLWQNPARSSGATNTPFVLALDGKVFYQTSGDSLNATIAADMTDGSILWISQPQFQNPWPLVWGSPLLYYNKLYLVKDGEGIFCFNAGTVDGVWTMQGCNIYATNSYFAPLVTRIKNDIKQPNGFILHQNYPNPFNPGTTIKYALPTAGYITISIYNVLGEEIRELVSENQSAGNYELYFNASDLTSGIYIYRLKTSTGFSNSRKMLLIK